MSNINSAVIALQMCSGISPEQNMAQLKALLAHLPSKRPLLVCLPEAFLVFAKSGEDTLATAQHSEHYKQQLSQLCKTHKIWLNAGTMPEPYGKNKYYAASHLFNDQGEIVASYNKMHLFDVTVADKTQQYRESDFTQEGNDVVVLATPFGKIGLTVCYDMRFGALYNALTRQGAEIILVPSAFTVVTGQAHWHTLLKARAIETQTYIVAAAQSGHHENGRHTYGHSIIISPWGDTISELPDGMGAITSELNLTSLHLIRRDMPVQSHQRFKEQLL
ncbi:carbon-nitrogen hydrolase family protein [Pseudoalteromonas sp. MMG010]|uniref:carbon-nitrogen hydrolase family protein n=1 Tax=Pseudoalteromonas sp. MMG010 TaxID=2822685 RepID=UPI001B3A4262|nr:carbon-nitrogen hydrolase family protein [Pseudoalteromonas sp. MMG010]MBQ4832669.1 carbon-nitrogen hydrolase family protein [Pseudoalteromonas sp. MMG010]